MSPAELDALREGLAEAAFRHAHAYPEKVCWAEVGRIASAIPDGVVAVAVEAAYARADALIASPILSDLIAKAGRVDAAEAVLRKYEPRFRTDALRPELQTLEERVAFACNEAIDGREGERRLAERAGITLDATATDDPAALLDALRAAAVERARLSAEVEAREAEAERWRSVLWSVCGRLQLPRSEPSGPADDEALYEREIDALEDDYRHAERERVANATRMHAAEAALVRFAEAAKGIPFHVSDAAPAARVVQDARHPGTFTTLTVADFRRAEKVLHEAASALAAGQDKTESGA